MKLALAAKLAEAVAEPFTLRLEAFVAEMKRVHGAAFSAPCADAPRVAADPPTPAAASTPAWGADAGAAGAAPLRVCFTGEIEAVSRRTLKFLMRYGLNFVYTEGAANADRLVATAEMRTQGDKGSGKFQDATRVGTPIWSPEEFLAHLPGTLETCLARAREQAAEAFRAQRASIPITLAPKSAADINKRVVVITGGVSGSGGDQGA